MSRWDGLAAVQTTTQSFLNNNRRLFDTGVTGSGSPVLSAGQQNFLRSSLLETRINTIDPGFNDCIYGVANTAATVVERCYKDIGCCEFGCCPNRFWSTRYGWAVALIVILCCLVIIAVVVVLVVWLINRAKDKQVKREVLQEVYSQHPTPLPASPIYNQPPESPDQYSFEPPHSNGYRY